MTTTTPTSEKSAPTDAGAVGSNVRQEAAVVEHIGPILDDRSTDGDATPNTGEVPPLASGEGHEETAAGGGVHGPTIEVNQSSIAGMPQPMSVPKTASLEAVPMFEKELLLSITEAKEDGCTATKDTECNNFKMGLGLSGLSCHDQEELVSVVSPMLSRFELFSVRQQPTLLDTAIIEPGVKTSPMRVESTPAAVDIVSTEPLIETESGALGTDDPQELAHGDVTPACNLEQNSFGSHSTFSWRPAEDVLPEEPEPVPSLIDRERRQVSTVVYSRRMRTPRTPPASPPASPEHPAPASLPAPREQQPSEDFLSRISKSLPHVIPAPVVQRRRRQAVTTAQAPRRSRRIAKLPPEINNQAAASVCRRLGFTDELNGVTEETNEKYTTFFEKPLSKEHVVTLAALLGKEVSDDTQVINEQVEVVA
ncbi:hypothetical protein PR202_ga12502 [Eleusine coracana subsp. coracana]|uniref:Uncharacterized protein n=1 Tax=Eleusine coracana subsp. coracana TaxID=191504 RepID=A0AAV5CC96_ELECO|nr:hypothetical protein PR202_ga12502 [Eleusine coracana subsp. coracana]